MGQPGKAVDNLIFFKCEIRLRVAFISIYSALNVSLEIALMPVKINFMKITITIKFDDPRNVLIDFDRMLYFTLNSLPSPLL